MFILDTESTCKCHCNKKLNSHSGCQNEQQADFEVQLENIITKTRHYSKVRPGLLFGRDRE